MNWNASGEPEAGAVDVAQPELDTRTLPSTGDAAGDWLCAWCLNRVANERDRFAIGGKDEFNFSNPDGFHFDIITFSDTKGCREAGVPTFEYTWFPGHAWSYCKCARCGQHLGWYYTGKNQFAGLIKDRILRALYIRN